MNIATGKAISYWKFTLIPMPPKTFKISTKTGIILSDSALTKGVEYQDQDDKEDSDYNPKDNNEKEDNDSYTFKTVT